MARTRNIKPGFFKNVKLAKLGPLSQVLFAGIWTVADREGRLEDEPERIKAEVLPYFKCNVHGLLSGLAEAGFIVRYSVRGLPYIAIPHDKWLKHQRPSSRELASCIPPPEEVEQKHNLGSAQAQPKHELSTEISLPEHNLGEPTRAPNCFTSAPLHLSSSKPVASGDTFPEYNPIPGWQWFMAIYPEGKVNPDLDGRLWISIVTSAEIEDKIRDHLPRAKRSEQWSKDDGKFIPLAETYLSKRKFNLSTGPQATGADRELTTAEYRKSMGWV